MAEEGIKLKKPDRIIGQRTTRGNLFRLWLEFLLPFHHMTGRELEVAALFLKERDELSRDISNETLVDRILMSDDTHKKIRTECNLTNQHYQVIRSKLKSKGFFQEDHINPRLLLKLKPDATEFSFLLLFPIIDDKERNISESSTGA